jgi:hypothetical protein
VGDSHSLSIPHIVAASNLTPTRASIFSTLS